MTTAMSNSANMRKTDCEQKVKDWFESPNTPPNAWCEWTLKDIANRAGVSVTSVQVHLPKIVCRHHELVKDFATYYWYRRTYAMCCKRPGAPIIDEDIKEIRELRKKFTIIEVIEMTGYGYSTVQKYSPKKYKKRKRNQKDKSQ